MSDCICAFYKKGFAKARFFAFVFLALPLVLFSAQSVDVAVIGSGPAGTSAALAAARKGLDTHLFLGQLPGGPLSKKAMIKNFPGSVSEAPIVPRLIEQLEQAKVTIHPDSIVSASLSSSPFILKTGSGHTIQASAVVIATGSRSTKLQIPGADTYLKEGNDQTILAIVGGGDDAANRALHAEKEGKTVHLLIRKDQLAKREKIEARERIQVHYRTEVREVIGDGKKMTGLLLSGGQRLAATDLFMGVGVEPNTHLFEKDLAIDANGYILLEGRTQQTSVSGVFAAGGVTDGRYGQAITSAGDGTKAGLDAARFLQD